MFDSDQYQLLDFGNGRRLERFGPVILDRPCPAADGIVPANPEAWQTADARFQGRNEDKGEWVYRSELPDRWTTAHGGLRFELKGTNFGHLGLFPEQAENWDWIAHVMSSLSLLPGEGQVEGKHTSPLPLGEGQGEGGSESTVALSSPHPLPLSRLRARGDPIKVLNLFAYTGGSTLAAAICGAEVTHVDAARNIVAWARRNAELSGLTGAPIRWITEDAVRFVKRELKRGRGYDAVILDPPSYGHGPRGEVWRLSKHLPRLLAMCGELTAGGPKFMLLTCHTPGYDPTALAQMVQEALGTAGSCTAQALTIRAATGAKLPSGIVVRWTPPQSPLRAPTEGWSGEGEGEGGHNTFVDP